MTYNEAREKADLAVIAARRVAGSAEDPGLADLAKAVDLIAQSLSELAAQLHRDN